MSNNDLLIREHLFPEFMQACDEIGISVETCLSKDKSPTIYKLRSLVWAKLRKKGWSIHEIAICSERSSASILRAIKIREGIED